MRLFELDLDHVLEHTRGIWEDVRGERLFLTGGTGFVGTWLLDSFRWANARLKLGAKAVVLSRCPPLTNDPAVKFIQGDAVSFDRPPGSFGFVIHAATERGADSFRRDIQTTQRVLDFAANCGAKRLLFTSSGAVYGHQPQEITHLLETYSGAPLTTDIHSAYGQGKRASEFLCTGSGAVIARLFAFVGPHLPLNAHYAVGNFIGNVLRSEPITITGDGTPYRSYLYAADMAIWLWTMLLRGANGEAYNVGSPEEVSILRLAETVAENTRPGTRIVTNSVAQPGALPLRYVPSIVRAQQELGLKVRIPLAEAIRRTYEWHLRQIETA